MNTLFFVFSQKIAVFFIFTVASMGAFFNATTLHNPASADTAIISHSFIVSPSLPVDAFANPEAVVPGLLGSTTVPFCPASSACALKALKRLAISFNALNTTDTLKTIVFPTNPTGTLAKNSPAKPPTKKSISPAVNAPPMTAQDILDDATVSFREQRTGPYDVLFDATSSNGENIAWDLSETSIGGVGTVPKDTLAFSCDPTPDPADPDSPDQSPMFAPKTTYTCSLSLTPQSGSDLATRSRTFTFTTPSGKLFVMRPTGMDSLLTDTQDQGGIVFDNEDTSPVTITGMTIDVSYTELNDLGQPLILRILDPFNGQSDGDYHLENTSTTAPSASSLFTVNKPDITIPLSFTIPASNQKVLPLELLNAQKMLIPGTSPSLSITVTGVTTNRSDIQTSIGNVAISWSCSIPTAGYDPNATSGPFFSGNACRN